MQDQGAWQSPKPADAHEKRQEARVQEISSAVGKGDVQERGPECNVQATSDDGSAQKREGGQRSLLREAVPPHSQLQPSTGKSLK